MTERPAASPAASPAAPTERRPPRRRGPLVVVALVALVALGVVLYLWLSSDAPAQVDIDDAVAGLESEPATGETATDDAAGGGASSDGTWTVDTTVEPYDLAASTGSFVGYRIDEELVNVGATQAVGRTPAVAGTLTVSSTTVSDAVVEGELTALVSDRPQRDGRTADALDVANFPSVTFVADAFELPQELADGDEVDVEVPGTLSVAGTELAVVAEVAAARRGEVVVVTGSLDVLLADAGIEAPSAASVLSVADTATIEWQLYLTR